MSLNTKRLAKLICNMLMDGYPQHKDLADAEFLRLNSFCAERANNIAMATPELLAECEEADHRLTREEVSQRIEQASAKFDAQMRQVFGTSIVGVEAGDFADDF